MELLGYVITSQSVRVNDGKKQYLGIDNASGGYPYWSGYVMSAQLHPTMEKPLIIVNGEEFVRESVMSSGTIYPPRLLHSGSGVNNTVREGEVIIRIEALYLGHSESDFQYEKKYSCRVKTPTGFIY